MASAPPVDAAYYYKVKMSNKGDSIEQIANKLGISVEQAQEYESQLSAIISNAKEEMRIAEKNLNSDRNASMGNVPYKVYDPNNPTHFGGRKSRRHAKKSRRHAKKSRRHAKKSRRHAKKSRRHAKKSRK